MDSSSQKTPNSMLLNLTTQFPAAGSRESLDNLGLNSHGRSVLEQQMLDPLAGVIDQSVASLTDATKDFSCVGHKFPTPQAAGQSDDTTSSVLAVPSPSEVGDSGLRVPSFSQTADSENNASSVVATPSQLKGDDHSCCHSRNEWTEMISSGAFEEFSKFLSEQSKHSANINKPPRELVDDLLAYYQGVDASCDQSVAVVNKTTDLLIPKTLDFGSVRHGGSKDMSFIIENVGAERREVRITQMPLSPFRCDVDRVRVAAHNSVSLVVRVRAGDTVQPGAHYSCVLMEGDDSCPSPQRNIHALALTVTITE